MDIVLTIAAMSLAVMLPVLVSLRRSGAPGVLAFALACLFALLSVSSELLSDILPDEMTVPVATLMMVASCLMILSGLRQFLGQSALKPAHIAGALGSIALFGLAGAYHATIVLPALASIAACGLFLAAGLMMLLQWPKERAISAYLIFCAVTVFVVAVVHGLRGATLVLAADTLFPGNDPTVLAHNLQTACMLGLPALFLGLILMLQGWLIANLRDLVARDELTGALSRRAFLEETEELYRMAIATNRPMAFMLLDLDRFKQINDRHGHAGGDKALALFTDTIKSFLGTRGLLGRLGGEEFGIALGWARRIEIAELADALCRLVRSQPVRLEDGTEIKLSVSIGVAISDPRCSLIELMSQADLALYEAKARGRDRFSIAESTPVSASSSARALAAAAAQMRAASEGPYIPPLSGTG
jgi:diguanylate cyclase (GGDEF)-like protein